MANGVHNVEWVCCASETDETCGEGLNSGRNYCEIVHQATLLRVDSEQDGRARQLVQYMAARYNHSSIATWAEHVREGRVSVNGIRTSQADLDRAIEPGTELCYHRPPWREPLPHAPYGLSVLYEDADVLVVLKPSGLAVMPSEQFYEHTVMATLKRMFAGRAIPSPAHRLGVGTSGALLCAKTPRARRSLPIQFQAGRVHKEYRALVTGTDMPDRFSCTQPIGLVPYPGMKEGLWAASGDGKPACSHCRVLERRKAEGRAGTTLLAVEIETGRPHQIRQVRASTSISTLGEALLASSLTRLDARAAFMLL